MTYIGVINSGGPSFEPWYRAQYPRVLASILLISGNPDTACEAVDEAFARAFVHWERIGGTESPQGWTYKVALNRLRRIHRRRLLERRAIGRTFADLSVPPQGYETWQVVAELPPRQREVVVLRIVADLPERVIGEVLGITRGSVSSTLRAAYRQLADKLGDAPMNESKGPCDVTTS